MGLGLDEGNARVLSRATLFLKASLQGMSRQISCDENYMVGPCSLDMGI